MTEPSTNGGGSEDVPRYDIGARDGGMVPHHKGDWVTLEDHLRIVTALREALAAVTGERDTQYRVAQGFCQDVANHARLWEEAKAERNAAENDRDQARQDLERVGRERDVMIGECQTAHGLYEKCRDERDALRGEVEATKEDLRVLHNLLVTKSKEMDHLGHAVPAGYLLGAAKCLRDIAKIEATPDQASGGGKQ